MYIKNIEKIKAKIQFVNM